MLGERAFVNNVCMIALTESHLKSFISDAEIEIPGYTLYRSDRSEETLKGGVVSYIREEYGVGSEVLSRGCNGVVEWLFIFLPVINILMANIYRLISLLQNFLPF